MGIQNFNTKVNQNVDIRQTDGQHHSISRNCFAIRPIKCLNHIPVYIINELLNLRQRSIVKFFHLSIKQDVLLAVFFLQEFFKLYPSGFVWHEIMEANSPFLNTQFCGNPHTAKSELTCTSLHCNIELFPFNIIPFKSNSTFSSMDIYYCHFGCCLFGLSDT